MDGEILITYRRTSRLSMRIVKNGDVHVSAPIGMPKEKVERFVEEHSDWIEKARRKTAERQRKRDEFYGQLPLDTRQRKEEAILRLKNIVEPLVDRYSLLMKNQPSAITYKAMISRWGVCNIRKCSICFSLYLLLLPEWCIEHVVVHEMCHLIEPRHNERFYGLMDRYFPRWRDARKMAGEIIRRD
ncbi:MAG: DUF45 domain-containing protein [Prevotella sp.]|nr:DUF45 domain-containing protein [Prevotella sp.]